ncbi:unnamed protein product [Caenorhabditis nigoni]
MLPDFLPCETKRDISMTLTKEALKSFETLRPRMDRSKSRESSRSRSTDTSDSEENNQVFNTVAPPVIFHHPSPVREDLPDGIEDEEPFKTHAFELNVQLEVASTFGMVSSLSFTTDLENNHNITGSILSFSDNQSNSLHVCPKIRRSSSPCVSFSTSGFPSPSSMPNVHKESANKKVSMSPIPRLKTEKLRKRSWDRRASEK